MTIMKKYLPIFYLGIKSSLVYRGNYLIKIITQVLNLIVTLWMWCWLMGNNMHNFNYLAKYLIMTNTLSLLFSIAPTFTLADLIQSGKLSNYLTKPVSLYWYLYLTYIGSQLPIIIFYLVLGLYFNLNIGFISLILYLIFCSFMFFNLALVFGSLGFWLINMWPLKSGLFAIYLLFGGLYFPLSMLGKNIYSWLQYNPFSLVTDVPAKLIASNINQTNIYYLAVAVWLIIFYCIYKKTFKLGLKKYEGVGV